MPTAMLDRKNKEIKNILEQKTLSSKEIDTIIDQYSLQNHKSLLKFIDDNFSQYNLQSLFKIAEIANDKRLDNSAYYTKQDICFSLIKDLPEFNKKNIIKVVEPSVGVGNFLPLLMKKYEHIPQVIIDAFDVDDKSIEICKLILQKIQINDNIQINFIHADFLTYDVQEKYDIAIGNPPFKKITNNQKLLLQYKKQFVNQKTNNLFAFFVEKCLKIANYTSLITPKSLINSPEYAKTRNILEQKKMIKINDYNEKAFDVKIETISFIVENTLVKKNHMIEIESYLLNKSFRQKQSYIIVEDFDCWLLYRDEFFDTISAKLEFSVFDVFRDRQITKKDLVDSGKIRVLKSRNIGNNTIKDIEKYDKFTNDADKFIVSKFLNEKNIVLVPNLTYYPRATFLPKNTIADGSVALLRPKKKVNEKDLDYFASDEFYQFYKRARNYGTRSLNIDANSVRFFGIKKQS